MTVRSPTRRFALGIAGLAALAAVAAPVVFTQTPPAPQLLSLTLITIKPEMVPAYIELQKGTTIPGMQKAGVAWRQTWRTAVFGTPNQFAHVTPIRGFDQYDSPNPLGAALGQEAYQAYLAKVRPMIDSQRVLALRTRPDLSFTAEGAQAQPLAILTIVQVQPTKLLDFEAFIKGEWIAALKKGGGKNYTVVQVLYGGGTTEFHTLVGIDKLADLASHPVAKALGEDGVTKLMVKSGAFASSIERSVMRLDPELSFETKPTSSK